MVKLTRIYTRGGDKGETSLGSGARVPKHALRVSAYGTVDEANAVIGVARVHTTADPKAAEADAMLRRIQDDLFDLGADLCVPEGGARQDGALRIVQSQIDRLEREIAAMNEQLKPLDSFILPGGSPAFIRSISRSSRSTCAATMRNAPAARRPSSGVHRSAPRSNRSF